MPRDMRDGGGLRVLVEGMSNADAIAFAVVGAARAIGVDPVEAVTTLDLSRWSAARCVPAAISVLSRDADDRTALCQILKRSPKAVQNAELRRTPDFSKASDGARSLVAFAAETMADDVEPPDQDLEAADAVPVAEDPEHRARTVEAFRASATQKLAEVKPFEPPKGASTVTALVSPFGVSAGAPQAPGASVRARILEALDGKSLTAQSLATVLGVKELVIGQTLSQMEKEGLLQRAGDGCATSRGVRWSLTPAWSGA